MLIAAACGHKGGAPQPTPASGSAPLAAEAVVAPDAATLIPDATVAEELVAPKVALFEDKNRKGAPPIEGELSASMIDQPIRHEQARFRACYEAGRKNKPALAGKVTAKIVIEADGKVGKHSASGLDEAVDACVDRVMASIRFPASSQLVNVTYPFVFKPE
jgi:outer membrane biosynthesis protein TonB